MLTVDASDVAGARPTILLTGAGGQLGRELAAALPACGTVIACDRAALDLRLPAMIEHVVRSIAPQFIVNAAAYTAVDRAEAERDLAFAVNADAPAVLASEAKRAGAVLFHYSTDYVFDGANTAPYDEDAHANPQNVYGMSKLAGEQAVHASDALALTLRTSWVYSRHGSNFLTTMQKLAAERDELRVVADQTGVPNWARAIAGAIVADTRVRVMPITTSEYPTPARRPAYGVLDATRFARTFGFALPDWRTSLRDCLRSPAEPPTALPVH
jgi:dTDP-4-dehydrorhamnose reductase